MKTNRVLIAAAAALTVATAAFAYEAGHPMWDSLFGKLDTNGDGAVSSAEFSQGAFKLFDVDGDGSIEPGECPGARFGGGHMMKRFGPGGPGAMEGPGHPGMGGFFIYSADADRNHEVTKAEWNAFLDKALGSDGQLSAEELAALMPERGRQEGPHHAEHLADFLGHLDRDGNDVVDAADFNEIFSHLDEDNNGAIEVGEFGHRMPRGPRR